MLIGGFRHTGRVTTSTPLRVNFVCTGNICRSPMAEVVFRELARRAGRENEFEVFSRGTQGWHQGKPADPRTLDALTASGYDGAAHRAGQVQDRDITDADVIVALDRGHEEMLLESGAPRDRVVLLSAFDPESPDDPDVFDPYYSDEQAFTDVLARIERSCAALLDHLVTHGRVVS